MNKNTKRKIKQFWNSNSLNEGVGRWWRNAQNTKTILISILSATLVISILSVIGWDVIMMYIASFLTIILLLLPFALYALPSIIASFRSHHNIAPIMIINLLLGWTGIGWIATLAWSFSKVEK